jgi:molecular chaperone GrpE
MMRNKTKNTPTEPDSPAASPAGETAPAAETADTAPSAAPGPSAGTSEANQTGAENGIAELQQALEASRGQYVRLLADFDNFRKRVARERTETIRQAGEEILSSLLPVLDHFELALRQAADPGDPFVVGIRMVYDQLAATLGKAGLAAINAQGAPFNPGDHEALAYQPSDEVAEGRVLLQTRCGYRLGDRVIRPATVIVSSGAPQAPEPPGTAPAGAPDDADEPVPAS